LFLPVILQRFGPVAAFGIPGVLMVISVIIFVAGSKQYVKKPPIGFRRVNFVSVNGFMLGKLFTNRNGESVVALAKKKFSNESVNAIMQVWKILGTFAFIPVFWALYDQNSSEWVLQATHMNLHFAGVDWLPQQIQSVNPILILAFIPLFSLYLYPALERRGFQFTPIPENYQRADIDRAFLRDHLLHSAQHRCGWNTRNRLADHRICHSYCAEVLISITGLEYAYTQAPDSMKSTLMSFWLLTVSTGNFLVTLINSNIAAGGFFSRLEGANYYLFFIAVISVTIVLFVVLRENGTGSMFPGCACTCSISGIKMKEE
jgi:POT family proton-dependent oligopeptide transporter